MAIALIATETQTTLRMLMVSSRVLVAAISEINFQTRLFADRVKFKLKNQNSKKLLMALFTCDAITIVDGGHHEKRTSSN